MTTRRPLGVAIAGTGFMGAEHARATRVNGGRLVGVCASTPERAREAAGLFGAERAYADMDELVTDPEVELVHVCTPNHQHAKLVEAALAAGKNVVCEKPLSTTSNTASALADRAAAAGVVGAVPFVYRFYAMVREARTRVAAGGLGRPFLVHGGYLQDWLAAPGTANWREDPALGGASRAFADIGSHWVDLVEFVTGDRLARLSAQLRAVHPDRRTEDLAVVQFATDGGAVGAVVISQVSPGHKNRLTVELAGRAGSLAFDQEHPEQLILRDEGAARIIDRGAAEVGSAAGRYSVLPPGHPQGYRDCFDAFVRDVHTAVDGAAPDGLPTFADGVRAAIITDAVLRSAATESAWTEVRSAL